MVKPIRQLFYVSRVAAGCQDVDIRRILAASRRHNRQLDVTGCLLFSGDVFAQVLEGDAVRLDKLLQDITMNPHHHSLRVLLAHEVDQRSFADWSMGYIYDVGKQERLHAALDSTSADGVAAAHLLLREMRVDPVMGGYAWD